MPSEIVTLALFAGRTVAAAAATDAWDSARSRFARLFGRGDPRRTQVADGWLEQTREQLTAAGPDTALERAQAGATERWAGRFADLLDEDPGIEAEVRALADDVASRLPAAAASGAGQSVAAGGDVNIRASESAMAAGVIHGNVAPPDPYSAGSGTALAEPGRFSYGPGSVGAAAGGTAIGSLVYSYPRRPDAATLPVRLAPRPVFLAGREALLAELDARLAASQDRPGPRLVALCGLGGAGKTSLAVEYAHRHLNEVGVCWQFAAEDAAVLASEFAVLAAQLGERDLVDARDPVASVHAALARAVTPWLLVFDNAPDLTSVAPFVPPAGPGRVLITTQNQHWPPGQAIDVPVLDPEVAADFLVNRTGDRDRRAALELAGELGGLPLALEQAAAYTQATGTSLGTYLPLFRNRQADLLSRGEVSAHPADVAATLGLALTRLAEDAPAAAGLLRVLAFLAPEPVPLALLFNSADAASLLDPEPAAVVGPLLADPVAAGDAVAALRRYSLVTPAAAGSVSVPRLVQAVTVDQVPPDLAGQWRQAAATLIESALPADPEDPRAWPAFAVLLPHVQAVLGPASDAMNAVATYLGASGNYAAARDLQEQVVQARRTEFGARHPATLSARDNLARWTGEAGDPAGARNQYTALHSAIKGQLGREHPETLTASANLAYWTGAAGDRAAARDQYAKLLPVMERVLGPEHPRTVAARGNLAAWTGEAGDPAAARNRYAELLPAIERVLGPEHPLTLTTRANLAAWTGEAGDPAAARDQFAALLAAAERILGPEHPQTLTIRADLARWTGGAGDPAAAIDQFAALVPVMERAIGPGHRATLAIRDSLAFWAGAGGRAATARDQYAALVPAMERALGPEHPETLITRGNLAAWTGEAGDPAAARDQFAALLPAMERVVGPDDAGTLTFRSLFARWTGEAGDPAAARDQYAALLPAIEWVTGPDGPETLATRSFFARWTGEAGDPAAARDQFAALLQAAEALVGPEAAETVGIRAGLARWTGEAGDQVAARDLLTALLPDIERVLGPGDAQTVTAALSLTLASGNVLLVGGPEIPVARNARGRTELLRWLVEQAVDPSMSSTGRQQARASLATGNLDQVARLLQGVRSGIESQIVSSYAAPSPAPAYDALARVAFTGAINMSWDGSLLDAFGPRSPVVVSGGPEDVLTAARSQEFAFTWFAGDPGHEQVAIGPQEVRARLLARETLRRFLTGAVQSSSLLFVGVRASDVIDFFDALTGSGSGQSSASTPAQRHFAVCAVDELWELNRSQLRDNFGVELIGYDPADAGALARIIGQLPDMARPYTAQGGAQAQPQVSGQVLSRVTLTNIGAFERLDLPLGQAWNLVLGANGCGKTTLLRAVALGMCGDHTLALEAGTGLLRTGCDQGLIELQAGTSRFRTELDRVQDTVRVRTSSLSPLQQGSWVVLGFPALRGMSLTAPSGISYMQAAEPRVEDLLPLLRNQVDARLDDIKQWIINVEARARQTGNHRERRMLDRFFGVLGDLTPGITVEFESVDQASWQVWVRTDDGVVPIDQLSQGMNSIIAWVGTLLQRMYDIYPDSGEPTAEPALVLIDELDAHLHPAWQRLLPGLAREHFPRVQFLATSHSPLVAGSLQRGELFVAERLPGTRADGTRYLATTVSSADVDPEGLRADQVLTSPLFGLMTSRSPEFGKKVERYSQLLTAPSPTPEEKAELQRLKSVIAASYRDGETAAERAAQAGQEADLDQALEDVEVNARNVAAFRRLADALGEAGEVSET